jgi:hypothetical protein
MRERASKGEEKRRGVSGREEEQKAKSMLSLFTLSDVHSFDEERPLPPPPPPPLPFLSQSATQIFLSPMDARFAQLHALTLDERRPLWKELQDLLLSSTQNNQNALPLTIEPILNSLLVR